MSKPTHYFPKANVTAQWYDSLWGWTTFTPNCACIHTTEGFGWPAYIRDGKVGAAAPHLTGLPDFANKRMIWRQHFNDNHSARALSNPAGGVETNKANILQVELIGTCDDRYRTSWGTRRAGVDYIHWPTAPDWATRGLAELLAYWNKRWGVKLTDGGLPWVTFDAYLRGNPRMTATQWRNFYGVCGHQHVPENTHGDPGSFGPVITKAFAYAKEINGDVAPPPIEEDPIMSMTPEDRAKLVDDIADAAAKKVLFRRFDDPNDPDGRDPYLWEFIVGGHAAAKSALARLKSDALVDAIRDDLVAAVREAAPDIDPDGVVAALLRRLRIVEGG